MTAAWIIRGDARQLPLADQSVQCIVTSPPYFGLRSYGGQTSVWGGDPNCSHTLEDGPARPPMTGGTGAASAKQVTNVGTQFGNAWTQVHPPGHRSSDTNPGPLQGPGNANRDRIGSALCSRCGAWSGELGSEPTPALFVEHLVDVFRECWRVLRDDGVAFVNIGDGYANDTKWGGSTGGKAAAGLHGNGAEGFRQKRATGSRPKSLLLVPERLAIALSDDGWIVRSRIAWCKAAPMPESVRDRPTSAWEHIWMLSKSGRYFYNADAVREPHAEKSFTVHTTPRKGTGTESTGEKFNKWLEDTGKGRVLNPAGANQRNWWLLSPDPYPGQHYACFPREIPRRCILAASREGDVVLDPFGGSQTTAFVAGSLGRRGVGVELSAEYVEQARYGRLAQDFLPLETA